MIEAHELTKRYGDTTAVHSLSFTIAPGTVTGFLGPYLSEIPAQRIATGLAETPPTSAVLLDAPP